ncbi:hypothetical protein GCK72_014824 [Caenorhabditis remanei]|uniref:lysozyme n=1 Tax=Caenorhabditis remanei TaxID=31234 RepID=A0A6A5GUT1_CAERE|nr:hypothetical protein GCK72_014824 [Caenorhabditis remanei]KAF1758366.1 hypothetical protein GCK72_014824 [Caenorhabditis remanei]
MSGCTGVGASLLGSLRETIERKSLTLEQWKAGKLAADWTDMIASVLEQQTSPIEWSNEVGVANCCPPKEEEEDDSFNETAIRRRRTRFILPFIYYSSDTQCYQPGKKDEDTENEAWMNCAQDYQCSASCIRTLASKFRVKCYGKSDCETIARIHDGGANGCRDRGTIGYWKRVRDSCGSECNKPIFSRYF